jgi:tRNA 2-thiouridine synthesizing protein B
MSPLHLIHRADALNAALARRGQEDALLLLDEGVYAALAGHPATAGLAGARVYLLREDLAARRIGEGRLAAGPQPIDMKEFVALTAAHSPIVSWF